jgi:hypothetical protein
LIVVAVDAPSFIDRLVSGQGAEDRKRVGQDLPKYLSAFDRIEAVASRRGGAELDANRFSERVALLEKLTEARLIGELQRAGEPFAAAAGEMEQMFGLLGVLRNRLLDEDVDAGFESSGGDLEMLICRSANMHDIQIILAETFVEALKGQGPGELAR